MKKIAFILCSFAIIFTLSCKNHSEKSTEELIREAANNSNVNVGGNNYSVSVPKGWRETDTSLNGLKSHIIFAPKNNNSTFSVNMNIMNESMQGYDLEAYEKAGLSSAQKAVTSFALVDNGNIETSSHVKGVWYHSTYSLKGYGIEGIEYIIPIDGIAYVITGVAKKGELSKYRNDFDNIAKSFSVKKQ